MPRTPAEKAEETGYRAVTMPSELLAILRDYAILFPTIISQEANAMLNMLLSMLSDEEDRKALYDLYMQYQDAMLRVARRYFPTDSASADDAVQNAWLRAIDNFSKISGSSALRVGMSGGRGEA